MPTLTGKMILPIVNETYEDHFMNNSWANPQEQIDAGYPIYLQPTNPTAQFVYTHDTGALISQDVLITIIVPFEQLVPTVEFTCTIETSPDLMSWDTFSDTLQAFTGNFRYVRVTIDFDADDDHEIAIVGPVRLRISVKRKTDSGSGTSSAVAPTTVTFNLPFIDIESILVTPAYNASYAVIANYDFVDTPYPTTFDVYCYRADTGAQVANDFSWDAKGV